MSSMHTDRARGRRITKQRPPLRVAVFTIDCATVWSGVCTYTAWAM